MSDGTEDTFYFILDPSALVYGGIGKIKKWKTEYSINFYIPRYTLKELDFLKKAFNSLIALNARESVRFIDQSISEDDNGFYLDDLSDVEDFETYNSEKAKASKSAKHSSQFILESPDESGPDWRKASGFRRRTPQLSEFPTKITGPGVFGSRIPGSFAPGSSISNSTSSHPSTLNQNAVVTEDEAYHLTNGKPYEMYEQSQAQSGERAEVPRRLRYLIRSCIQKQFIENKNYSSKENPKWIVICEDPTTTIWLKCFGINVKNLNEAQSIIDEVAGFDNKALFDPTSSALSYDSRSSRKLGVRRGSTPPSEIENLQKEQGQANSNGKRSKRDSKKKSSTKTEVRQTEPDSFGTSGTVKKEKYDSMTYAPRGNGQLWTP